jgi:hypothetical protein
MAGRIRSILDPALMHNKKATCRFLSFKVASLLMGTVGVEPTTLPTCQSGCGCHIGVVLEMPLYLIG